MKTLPLFLAWLLLPLVALAQPLEPYRHNFFTTNPAPVVEVVGGTNTSVQLSLIGTGTRRYTVNNDTNLIPIYAGTSGGQTNQVFTQTGWSGYPQVTNLSLITNNIGTAIVPNLWLTNPTPAALGAQQNSPALMLGGQGWRSGNGPTKPVQMGLYTLPVQGSSAEPTAQLAVSKSINGAIPTSTSVFFDDAGKIGGSLLTVSADIDNNIVLGSGAGSSGVQLALAKGGRIGSSGAFSGAIYLRRIDGGFGIGYDLGSKGWNPDNDNLVTLGTLPFRYANIYCVDGTYSGIVTSTNGFKYVADSNGFAAPLNVASPVHAWGFLSVSNAATTHILTPLSGTGVYTLVTNYNVVRTNLFTGPAMNVSMDGSLTNVLPGWYRISFSVTVIPGNANQVETDIAINTVTDDEIAAHSTTVTPARSMTMSGNGVRYLPAGTAVSIKCQNVDSTTLQIEHAQLTVSGL